MKGIGFLFIFLLLLVKSNAQKNGDTWILGTSEPNPDSSICQHIILNFSNENLSIDTHHYRINFLRSTLTYSDSAGHLLFMTNGYAIINAEGDTLANGANLGSNSTYVNEIKFYGLNVSQTNLALPWPGFENSKVGLFFWTPEWIVNGGESYSKDLRLTTINTVNNPFILSKGTLIENKNFSTGGGGAIKHANGRDWWVFHMFNKLDSVAKWILTPSGISLTDYQQLNNIEDFRFSNCVNAINPQGDKVAFQQLYPAINRLALYDFDRCTGLFSNERTLDIAPFLNSMNNVNNSWAFSPNGRYLYFNNGLTGYKVYQIDTEIQDLNQAITVVADNGGANSWDHAYVSMKLGSDGKIYIITGAAGEKLSVIAKPNNHGILCQFQSEIIDLPWFCYSGTLSGTPNYRLGPIDGSICDSLGIDNPDTSIGLPETRPGMFFFCYPNPVKENLNVVLPKIVSNFVCRLFNSSGQLVMEESYTKKIAEFSLALQDVQSGLYQLQVIKNGQVMWEKKVMKE